MKAKTIIGMALVLSSLSVQNANAQFFKKLGKVAGALLDATTESSKTSNNSNSSSSDTKGYIPHIDFKVTSCEYWGDEVLLRFIVNNTSTSDITFRPFWGEINDAYATDDNNNIHAISFNVGGEDSWGGELFKTLPAGVPVKGFISIKKVSTSCRFIKSVRFGGIVEDGKNNQKFSYTIGSNAIKMPSNTNADNIFVSLPILQYNLNRVYRDKTGKNVIVDATVKNIGTDAFKLAASDGSGHAVYDSEGNSYKHTMTIGGKSIDNWDGVTLQPDIPMKALITIPNVPSNIHEFSIIKHRTVCGDNYYDIQIKNQKF